MKFLELKDTTTECPYLPDRSFTAENFLAPNLRSPEIDKLLAAGFRHFGSYYFRPVCESCSRCVPLRLRSGSFFLSRSLKRVLKANSDLLVTAGPPAPSDRSYSLYRKHQLRFEHRSSSTYEQYVRSFCTQTVGNTQLSVFAGSALVSVLHLDVTSISVSAVYCYYDTDLSERGLGSFSIVKAIQCAAGWGVDKVYLGYSVLGNRHMMYKTRYRPNEILVRNGWVPYCDKSGQAANSDKYAEGYPGRDLRVTHPFSRVLLYSDK